MGLAKVYNTTNTLFGDTFIRGTENTVVFAKYTDKVAKELGGSISIECFTRFEKGEGLEKRNDNFADEVANMVK